MPAFRLTIVAAALLVPAVLAAQGEGTPTRCNAINTDSTREVDIKLPSNQYNSFFGGGVYVKCPSKNIVLRADSAEQYGDERRIYLVGHVLYQEPRLTLHSDFLNYYTADERVVATGNVDATMPNGSRLVGPNATYLRAIPKRRPLATVSADGRPTITLIQLDSLGKPQLPMQVVANTVFMDGDSLVYAGGKVDITRQEFTAHGDSMFLDGQKEIMHLMHDPKIVGRKGNKPFTLVGTLIDLYSQQRKLRRVLARGAAVATSEDLRLRSDTIDMRLTNDELQRTMAWGPHRAGAKSPTDSLLADSLDVIMPNQRAREIHAIGKAYAESKPDTVKFRTKEMDWMRGDTILAIFDTMPPQDTSQGPRIRQLIAIDSGAAYYNMAPKDTSLCAPTVSYSRGHRIVVSFGDKGVETVDVVGQTLGMLDEPKLDSATTIACGKPFPKPPSTKKQADTTATAPHKGRGGDHPRPITYSTSIRRP